MSIGRRANRPDGKMGRLPLRGMFGVKTPVNKAFKKELSAKRRRRDKQATQEDR